MAVSGTHYICLHRFHLYYILFTILLLFTVAYLGLCVSGQKISDLLRRVKEGFYPTSERAIVMIGTNDLLQVRYEIQSIVSE